MEITKTKIEGLLLLNPTIYTDNRGFFYESFNRSYFSKNISIVEFVQDNSSSSKKNVLRGLHFQIPPFAQAKLVTVLKGAVLDVAVDLRKNSKTYGESFSIELNEHNKTQMYIPRGFAHGFVTLEDNSFFSYKVDNAYDKKSERSIAWNDSTLDIDWGTINPIISSKDMHDTIAFSNFNSPFL